MDWHAWHANYDDPTSDLSRRLVAVRSQVEAWLDQHPDGPLRVVSGCSGDGRDLLDVLERRDGSRVAATLVELDPELARRASDRARDAALAGVEVRCADAGQTDGYAGAVPADLVMMCGVFGNMTDDDVRRTIATLPTFCAPGAWVLWTRGRDVGEADLTGRIRGWFQEEGFTELGFDAPDDTSYRLGTCRYDGPPREFESGRRLFTFTR